MHKASEQTLVPQHGIGAQYLEPAPYVSAVGAISAVGMPGVPPMSLPPLPVIVCPDQAQLQVSVVTTKLRCSYLIDEFVEN